MAVAALLLSALDHLVTALIGWPPAAYMTRRVAAPIRDAWRAATWRSSTRGPVAIITIRTTPSPERNSADANPTR